MKNGIRASSRRLENSKAPLSSYAVYGATPNQSPSNSIKTPFIPGGLQQQVPSVNPGQSAETIGPVKTESIALPSQRLLSMHHLITALRSEIFGDPNLTCARQWLPSRPVSISWIPLGLSMVELYHVHEFEKTWCFLVLCIEQSEMVRGCDWYWISTCSMLLILSRHAVPHSRGPSVRASM